MRKLTENIKSLLVIILGLLIPVLWTYYIYVQFDPAEAKASYLENSFWIFTENTQHTEIKANSELLLPEAVSLLSSGSGYTSAHNSQLTKTLYNDCKPLITEIFSPSYICKKSTKDKWEKALSLPDSILIEYTSQLPYTYIAQLLQVDKPFCEGEICYTKKLLLFNDEKNMLTALAVDGNGDVYEFLRNTDLAPSLIYDFNSNNIAAYTVNEGFIPFEFNLKSDANKSFEYLPSEYKLLLSPLSLPSIEVNTPLTSIIEGVFGEDTSTYLDLIEDRTLSELFSIFNVNPNIAGYYSDPHSGLYFVGENMHLIISPNGNVSYSVTDKNKPNITVASLLDTTRTEFTSDEILTAATVFISEFSSETLGGEAVPILQGVNYSSAKQEITFTFGYYFMQTGLYRNGENKAISVTFNNSGLIRTDFLPLTVTKADDANNSQTSLLTSDTLPHFAAQLLETPSVLQPIYSFDAFNTTVTPYWAAGGQ